MKKELLAIALLLLAVLPAAARSQTMYITDEVEAAVNTGKGLAAGSMFLDVVRTGDRVEVLRTEGEYARIALANGTEGWLHTRYLTEQQPLDNEQLKEKVKALQQELAGLREEKTGLEKLRDEQAAQIKQEEQAYESLKSECADVIKARAEVDRVQQELQASSQTVAQLKRENEELVQNTQLMWFIFGAAAVLCGFIIGMWLQGLRRRRKSKFSF